MTDDHASSSSDEEKDAQPRGDAAGADRNPGGGPKRIVSETSVDDILASIGDSSDDTDPDPADFDKEAETVADEAGDATDEATAEIGDDVTDDSGDETHPHNAAADAENSAVSAERNAADVQDTSAGTADETVSTAAEDADAVDETVGSEDGDAEAADKAVDTGDDETDATDGTADTEDEAPDGSAVDVGLESEGSAADAESQETSDELAGDEDTENADAVDTREPDVEVTTDAVATLEGEVSPAPQEESSHETQPDLADRIERGAVTGADVRAAETGEGRDPTPSVDEIDLSIDDIEDPASETAGSSADGTDSVDDEASTESSGLLSRLKRLFSR